MKRFKFIRTPVILVVIVLIWQGCCTSNLHFSGKVVDKSGKGIPEATVQVGEKEGKTDKNGQFEICVSRSDKSGKYVLNASRLGFGFFSRAYQDTASNLVITLSKATVVTVPANQDIVVQDLNPEMTNPGSTSAAVISPLDSIPFVYDSKGNLIGFRKPQQLIDDARAIANFQSPVLGAKIEIPAGSLVFEGTDKKPEQDIQVSVNTIDVYSADGMPGNYAVDLGEKGGRGFMVTFGAANIDLYSGGQALQLASNKTATLTIPVDTLSILMSDSLPSQIPLLIYNRNTGFWNVNGSAQLNASRSAYSTQINHFSTFNMDMFKTTPSCIQLCDGITGANKEIHVTVNSTMGSSSALAWTDPTPCADPNSRCDAFGISPSNVTGIINIPNSPAVATIEVLSGTPATLAATYVFDTGLQPAGLPDDYQKCPFDNCSGPFKITDIPDCWETVDGMGKLTGTMRGPLLSVIRAGDNFTFSWLFIRAIVGGVIANGTVLYKIEYDTDASFISATEVQFPAGIGTDPVITSMNYIEGPHTVTITGLSPSVYFRMLFSTDGGATYEYGVKSCNGTCLGFGNRCEYLTP